LGLELHSWGGITSGNGEGTENRRPRRKGVGRARDRAARFLAAHLYGASGFAQSSAGMTRTAVAPHCTEGLGCDPNCAEASHGGPFHVGGCSFYFPRRPICDFDQLLLAKLIEY
jgi:hypothetical protein